MNRLSSKMYISSPVDNCLPQTVQLKHVTWYTQSRALRTRSVGAMPCLHPPHLDPKRLFKRKEGKNSSDYDHWRHHEVFIHRWSVFDWLLVPRWKRLPSFDLITTIVSGTLESIERLYCVRVKRRLCTLEFIQKVIYVPLKDAYATLFGIRKSKVAVKIHFMQRGRS